MDIAPSNSLMSQILLIGVLIIINAFFASAEMAIVSLNKNKINSLASAGNSNAKLLCKLLENPSNFLATIQIGITFAGFFASASAATSISEKLASHMANIPYSNEISVIIITLLISYITLVLGELVPKRIALQNADSIALKVVYPISIISKITIPLVKFLSFSTNVVLKLLRVNTSEENEEISKEDIMSMIRTGQTSGVLDKKSHDIIQNVFELDQTIAREIMTPKVKVFSLDINTPISEVLERLQTEKHSRIPIYDESSSNIVGILHIKDLYRAIIKNGSDTTLLKDIIKEPLIVPEYINTKILFNKLQSCGKQMAILVNEYGVFTGTVTLEDLLEEIVGEIDDEHDIMDDSLIKIGSNVYLVDGFLSIEDINRRLNLDIECKDLDSIGGFIIKSLGALSNSKDILYVKHKNLKFEVINHDLRRIKKLKLIINES